jgi:hypothetical protein
MPIRSNAHEEGGIEQTPIQTTDNAQDTPMMPFLGVFAILAASYIRRSGRKP